jgi:DNA segregation ATPase FtsK/SpoIIIE, S-DNA-T family
MSADTHRAGHAFAAKLLGLPLLWRLTWSTAKLTVRLPLRGVWGVAVLWLSTLTSRRGLMANLCIGGTALWAWFVVRPLAHHMPAVLAVLVAFALVAAAVVVFDRVRTRVADLRDPGRVAPRDHRLLERVRALLADPFAALREHRKLRRIRRRFDRYCRTAAVDLYRPPKVDRDGKAIPGTERCAPAVTKVTRTAHEVTFRLHLTDWTVDDLQKRVGILTGKFDGRYATVTADRGDVSRATLRIVLQDPLEAVTAAPVVAGARSVWDPVPFGLDEHGCEVTVALATDGGGRMVLLGGITGSGKSVGVSLLLAHCALSPDCRMTLFDGKRVELAAWAPFADRVVGRDAEEALEVLAGIRRDMDERLGQLLAAGRRKVTRGTPVHVVVVDELAYYTAQAGTKQQQQEFARLLGELVALGRAAGICVIAATQKPSVNVVPSVLRDNFATRVAFRTANYHASETILGAGAKDSGHDASTIPDGNEGVCLLAGEDGDTRRARAYLLKDDDVDQVAHAAMEIRGATAPCEPVEAPLAPVEPAPVSRPSPKRQAAERALVAALDAHPEGFATKTAWVAAAGLQWVKTPRDAIGKLDLDGIVTFTDGKWRLTDPIAGDVPA